jgi:hypothetical protein
LLKTSTALIIFSWLGWIWAERGVYEANLVDHIRTVIVLFDHTSAGLDEFLEPEFKVVKAIGITRRDKVSELLRRRAE